MSLPAGYYRIDPDIRALVAAMNVHGFRTYASCQGHGFPVTKLPPYYRLCLSGKNGCPSGAATAAGC